MGYADPPSVPHQRRLGVGSKLPLPLYADVRLRIPMTHLINDTKARLG